MKITMPALRGAVLVLLVIGFILTVVWARAAAHAQEQQCRDRGGSPIWVGRTYSCQMPAPRGTP